MIIALPTDIQEIFFDAMLGEMLVTDFEQWLYADQRLEKLLPGEDYLELISFGYKDQPAVSYELYKLLERLTDKAAFEKYRLLKVLYRVLKRDEKFAEMLKSLYHLYCKGYSFLQTVGLKYGLNIDIYHSPAPGDVIPGFNDLSEPEKKELLDNIGPELEVDVKKVIYWLENGLVVPAGTMDWMEHWEYVDLRSEEERERKGD